MFREQNAACQEINPDDFWSADVIFKDGHLERELNLELPLSQPMNDVGYSPLIR
jgi:hypothetical protein